MKSLLYGIVEKIRNFLQSEVVTSSHIGQQASALTLTTLFALVPLVSGVLWIVAHLPAFQTILLEQFDVLLSSLVPEQAMTWRNRADVWVDDIAGLQTISAVMLFVSLMFLVNQVDRALHWVFQVDKRRGKRRWLHYLWVMPLLMTVLVITMTLVVLLQILLGTGLLAVLPGVNLTSIPAMWILLVAVYQLASRGTVPVIRTMSVSFGVTLGFYVLKTIFAWLYLNLPNWSLVFGIFSAIPLFLLWCQMAWSLFLYGALVLRWLSRGESKLKKDES